MFRGLPTFANAAGKSPAPAVPTRVAGPTLPLALPRAALPNLAVANNLLAAAGPAADPRTMLNGSAFPAFVSRSAPPVTQYVPVRSTPGHLNNLAQALTGPPHPQSPVPTAGMPRPALPRAGMPSAASLPQERGAVPARFGSRPLATPKKSPPLLETNRQGSLLGQAPPPSAESMRQGAVMNAVRLAMRQAMRARLTPVQTPRPPVAQPSVPQPQPSAQRASSVQRPPVLPPAAALPQNSAPASPPALTARPAGPARPTPAPAPPAAAPVAKAPPTATRATTPAPAGPPAPAPVSPQANAAAPAAPTPAKTLSAAEPPAATPLAAKVAASAAAPPAASGERTGPVRELASRNNVSLAPLEVSPGSRDKSAAAREPFEPIRSAPPAGNGEAPRVNAPARAEREATADFGRQQHAGVRPTGLEQRPVVEWARAQTSESLSSSGFGGSGGGGGGGGGGRRERRQEEEQSQEADGLTAVRLAPSRLADAGTNVGLDWLGGDPELGLRHSAQAREALPHGRTPAGIATSPNKRVPQRRWNDEPHAPEQAPPRFVPQPLQSWEPAPPADLLEAGALCACCGSFLGRLRQRECPRCREQSARAMRELAAGCAGFSIWLWTTRDPRPVRCTRGFRLTDFRPLPSASFG